jgi:hypothetical protein
MDPRHQARGTRVSLIACRNDDLPAVLLVEPFDARHIALREASEQRALNQTPRICCHQCVESSFNGLEGELGFGTMNHDASLNRDK